MKVIFDKDECLSLIYVVTGALVRANLLDKETREFLLDEDDEVNSKRLEKAQEFLGEALDKLYGKIEVHDVTLSEAITLGDEES